MGLLSAAPPNGAIRAGPNEILGACHPKVKRKSIIVCPYLFVRTQLTSCRDFRLWIRRVENFHTGPSRTLEILQPAPDKGGHTRGKSELAGASNCRNPCRSCGPVARRRPCA